MASDNTTNVAEPKCHFVSYTLLRLELFVMPGYTAQGHS
jgi:hypothetical protein